MRDNSKLRILSVVALYKCHWSHSPSVSSLFAAKVGLSVDLHIFLVDNSSDSDPLTPVVPDITYVACPQNLGLANAYNRAVEFAEREGYDWLLTLDQDTDLPIDFLAKLEQAIRSVEGRPEIAAIVPQIIASGKVVSPNYFWAGAVARWFDPGYTGVPAMPTYAFNSASTLRTDAIRQVGGYSPYFWLDNSDAQMFHSLHLMGKSVYVMGDVEVQHDFSMKEMNNRVTPWRYRHILLAESAFWDSEMNWLAGIERTLRLAARLLKHIGRGDSTELRRITLEFLILRLFRSRSYRLGLFRASVKEHLGANLVGTALLRASPKVSVCMAAYNGGPYVVEQFDSILTQLGSHDEVVVVDDASADNTAQLILSIRDERVLMIRHERNVGVIATFEEAVRNATGDILFLSDDDDVWMPNKVERFMAEFERDPKIQVVMSSVALIDSEGNRFKDRRFDRDGRFRRGFLHNWIKNGYQGSAMAFRSTLLRHFLPIPKKRGFLHDVWIGTRNDLTAGETAYIEEPLLLYRRHQKNFSNRLNIWRQGGLRFWLMVEHFLRLGK